MSTISPKVSTCRHCLYYQVEGRRGGNCRQLGVPVQAQWKACPLATSCFVESSVMVDKDLIYQPAIAPVMEVIPTVAMVDIPTAAEVIPIADAARRLVRPPSMMA